jgi:DNA-binding CsgD family transcriptional regulator
MQTDNPLSMNKNWLLLIVFLIGSVFSQAQWSYPVTNFTRSDYKAGAQSWQIRSGANGWIYVANNKGLLEYNGQNWSAYSIPNDNVRSMLIIPGKRIYAGGISEFGYFEPDENGRFRYVSLSRDIIPKYGSFGNIWNIFQIDQTIYYQADGMVIKQTGNAITYINANVKIDCSAVINGLLYLGTKKGLYVLMGNKIFPAPYSEILSGMRIRSLVPLDRGRMLIGTANDGLFICDNESIKRFQTEVSGFIQENELFCCAASPNYIAIGTIKNGAVVITHEGRAVTFSNMANGLQDNTVLSLTFDMSENLWMGLNKGISSLRLNGALSTLYAPPNFYGVGYSARQVNDLMYFGTNEGLYYSKWPINVSPNPLKMNAVPGLNGQVWNLNMIQGKLFCAHDKGVFIVEGQHVSQWFDTGGAWAAKLSADSSLIYIGCYSGLFILRKQGGRWSVLKRIAGYFDSTRFFEQDGSGLWVSHDQKGIIRLVFNEDKETLKLIKYYGPSQGLPSDKKVGIEKIGGKIVFITPFGIYHYNPRKDIMELDKGNTGMHRFFAAGTKSLAPYGSSMWSVSENQIKLFTPKGVFEDNIKDGLDLKEGYEMIYPLDASSALIATERGFYQAHFRKQVKTRENLFLHIKKVILSKNDSLYYRASFANTPALPAIGYGTNSIKFEFGAVDYLLNSDVKYSYKLENYDDSWSAPSDQTVKEYTDLHEGKYIFRVKAVTSSGQVAYQEFSFRIMPPWYRSWWAFVIYIILIVIVVRFLLRMDRMRIQHREREAQRRKQEEMDAIAVEYKRLETEREKEIMRLKSEQLESDLVHKSQELSGVMLSFVSKNETLRDIKSDLFRISNAIPENESQNVKRRLFALTNKIDLSMQHDEDWKKFEKNFDYVHNGFIQKLAEKYPDLTFSERKMCVYLKMELVSKEIASLLNISPRSVETVRYRLRKKFGLDREDNLRDFLNRL